MMIGNKISYAGVNSACATSDLFQLPVIYDSHPAHESPLLDSVGLNAAMVTPKNLSINPFLNQKAKIKI